MIAQKEIVSQQGEDRVCIFIPGTAVSDFAMGAREANTNVPNFKADSQFLQVFQNQED